MQTTDPARLARLAIMTYSFDRIIKSPGHEQGAGRTLELFDVPAMFADHYKVHNVEVQHDHFASTEPAYFKGFLARLAAAKSRVSNINLEFYDNDPIYNPTNYLRLQVIDLTKQWIDHAVTLGCPRVMIDQGRLTEENKAVAIETIRTMVAYGKTKNIKVSLEPRGGGGEGRGRGRAGAPGAMPPAVSPAAERPFYDLLAEVIKASGAFANVDIGNFGDQEAQHAGIRALMPYTVGNTHIKMNPARYDFAAAIALLEEFKYAGLYSIEAVGPQGSDPYDNVQRICDALLPLI